jgi:hypothetical protein
MFTQLLFGKGCIYVYILYPVFVKQIGNSSVLYRTCFHKAAYTPYYVLWITEQMDSNAVYRLLRFYDGSDSECGIIKFSAYLRKTVTETLAMTRQAVRVESMSQTHRDRKKARQVKKQSQEHAHHFPKASRGLLSKNSSW